MNLSFGPLSSAEQESILEQLERARAFSFRYVPSAAEVTLESLDEAFNLFLDSEYPPIDAHEVIFAVGVFLGAKLVDELGFQWTVATDDYGRELAVQARPGRGDVTIFPMDFVAKRYERGESYFLVDAIAQIRESLKEIAREWGDFE